MPPPDDILTQNEGKTLEFKRDVSSPMPILRTIVAFANTAGGTVLIGVEDRTREVIGVADPLDAEERIVSLLSDGISPRILPEIEVIPWRSTSLLSITVHPGAAMPYHVTKLGPLQGTYVRVGSTNRAADGPLIEELRRTAAGTSYDEEPVVGLTPRALDSKLLSKALGRRVDASALRSLRATTEHQGRSVPTVAGLLAAGGPERAERFPDAYLMAGRFRGTNKSTIVDTRDIRTPLALLPDEAMAFVTRNIAMGVQISGVRGRRVWALPLEAVREGVTNAVVHADYSQRGAPLRLAIYDERIEIDNPGMLVPGLTIADVLSGVSKLRNRVIGRLFRELELIEQWGSGVGRMTAAMREAGLPDPEFEEIGFGFRVTLRFERTAPPKIDELDHTALAALAQADGLSTRDISERIGRTTRATRQRLAQLVERGLVVEVGSGPNDPKRRYFIAEDAAKYL
ncbi:MAG: putative DNA binding domain-containing protein [Coriobacteriales bacterium]|nr:putative DNA binding domain-containing protein [Coriobacteriales bacterium]